MKSFLIIKTGKSFNSIIDKHGDFDEFTIKAFSKEITNLAITDAQTLPKYPSHNDLYGVVITGAHENTTENSPWMIHLKEWIKSILRYNTPILGICFGHQIIAEALGGTVGFNTKGGEFGIVKVKKDKTAICSKSINIPDEFYVFASHYQSVINLPNGAISIANNTDEANHFVCYTNNIWGFQFHPEFNRSIIKVHQQKNKTKGLKETDKLFKQTEDFGGLLLDQFYEICHNTQ